MFSYMGLYTEINKLTSQLTSKKKKTTAFVTYKQKLLFQLLRWGQTTRKH